MKKNIIILATALLLMFSYGFGQVSFHSTYQEPDMSLAKDAYIASFANLTFAQADRIAQKIWEETGTSLVLDEQAMEDNMQMYRTIDNSATCKIDTLTGDVFFRRHSKFEGSAPGLPAKGDAEVIAKQYLKALGLFKKDMGDVVINTLNEAVYDGQTTQTFEKMRIVTFTRTLGDIPVLGASRATVMLGANGDLEGLAVRWMDITASKSLAHKVDNTKLKSHLKSKLLAKKIESNVVVKKSNLIIFDDGQGHMTPMLHVEGELVLPEGNFFSDWMVPVN